jgi:UPF0755 protein
MVERRPGVMPPRPGPPPRQVPRSRIVRRRVGAVGILLAILAAGIGIALAARGSGKTAAPPTTTRIVLAHQFRVIFPEGFTRAEMGARVQAVARIAHRERGVHPRLSRRTYLAVTTGRRHIPGFGPKPYPLEGFLFPATYDFTAKTTSAQLVQTQLRAFESNWNQIDLSYARSKNLTPYDVLTIASMIEKEAVAPEDRPKVARVIYNRLHLKMTLGMDSTIRYALHVPATKSLTQSELNSDTPYNTRKFAGLPPTPISNPGLASMQAAAHPAPGNWLYFVAEPDKVHSFFTASETAFERYKAQHGYHPH